MEQEKIKALFIVLGAGLIQQDRTMQILAAMELTSIDNADEEIAKVMKSIMPYLPEAIQIDLANKMEIAWAKFGITDQVVA